jgi:tRNA-(ms[2]io[6]A)-hydroxylase
MLGLQSKTPGRWVEAVEQDIPALLIDHAHCEKKAAGTALNLIFSYVEQVEFVRALTEIAREELEHLDCVLNLLHGRGIVFRRQQPSSYGARLARLIHPGEPQRAVDRCLIAALIEARSCERFAILRDQLDDKGLAQFFAQFFATEARHHTTFVRLAEIFEPTVVVSARLAELARREAEIIAQGDPFPRIHS